MVTRPRRIREEGTISYIFAKAEQQFVNELNLFTENLHPDVEHGFLLNLQRLQVISYLYENTAPGALATVVEANTSKYKELLFGGYTDPEIAQFGLSTVATACEITAAIFSNSLRTKV